MRQHGARLKEPRQFIGRDASLLQNGAQSASLQVPVVEGHRNEDARSIRMAEIMMAASDVMQHEAGPAERPDKLPRRNDRRGVHAFSMATAIVSLMAPASTASSDGKATPSLASTSR